MAIRNVEFDSQGITLRGLLYEPEGAAKASPAVAMAHGLSATIDGMVAEQFATVFLAAGLSVLLYDHPYLGRSDGEPRQRISIWRQARGFIDALTFLASQPGIAPERIGLWGDSLSAGESILVSSIDPRVAALVVQVPSCGREAPPPDVDAEAYVNSVQEFLAGDIESATFEEAAELPVVSADQLNAPSLLQPLTAFRWFIEYGGRFGTNWQNRGTRTEPKGAPPYYPPLSAGQIRIPAHFTIAHNDEIPGSRPDVQRLAFDSLQGPKQLLEVDGGHFGLLYYPGKVFDEVVASQASFFSEHL
jgi:dienelactone hydrolase